jgi:hypothetical protein
MPLRPFPVYPLRHRFFLLAVADPDSVRRSFANICPAWRKIAAGFNRALNSANSFSIARACTKCSRNSQIVSAPPPLLIAKATESRHTAICKRFLEALSNCFIQDCVLFAFPVGQWLSSRSSEGFGEPCVRAFMIAAGRDRVRVGVSVSNLRL